MTITIVLAGEPQGKGRPRFARATGHAFTPTATRRYESALRYAAQQAMGDQPPLDGPLRVEVTAAFPIPQSWPKWRQRCALAGTEWHDKAPDADNLLKVLDALNEIVFRDDKQIVQATVSKLYSAHPSFTVIVDPIVRATARQGLPEAAPLLALEEPGAPSA